MIPIVLQKKLYTKSVLVYYWNFGGKVHIEELRNGSQVLARIPGLHPTSGHHPPDRQVVKHTGAPIVKFPGATSPWLSPSTWSWVEHPLVPLELGRLRQRRTWARRLGWWSTSSTAPSKWIISLVETSSRVLLKQVVDPMKGYCCKI